MKSEEDESALRTLSGADRAKKPRKHNHIGPNVRAFRIGRAFCPVCDAEKGLRITQDERDAERAVLTARREQENPGRYVSRTRR